MQHTYATSSSTLRCDDSDKVNLVDQFLVVIFVFLHIIVYCRCHSMFLYPVYMNYLGYEVSEVATSYEL